MKQKLVRDLHRDLGYFYVGLIISFAFSGILMNHREQWHPEKYTVETKNISVKLPEESAITEAYAENLGKQLGIEDKMRRHNVKKGTFKISFEKHDVEIDMKTGKGEIVAFHKTPIISLELVDLLLRYFWHFVNTNCRYRNSNDYPRQKHL
jgi:hypothetical protein